MMANMTNSLFQHGRITTTTPKAKELRRVAERMVTLGKKGDVPCKEAGNGLYAAQGCCNKAL